MNCIGLAKLVIAGIADNRTVRRVVDLVDVRRGRRQDVQRGFQPVQRLRLQQRVGHVARLLTSWVSTSRFLSRNGRTVVSRLSNCWIALARSLIGAGRGCVVNCGQVLVQRDELLVVLVQRVDEQRQAAHHREEVAAALVQRGQRLRQAVQRGVDLLALAGQPVGERLDDLTERPLRLLLASGPSLEMMLVMLLRSSSHSTGTWVRSIGITALSASTGPPLYGGSNWMLRDATRVGLRITAEALAGTLYLFS